MDLSVLSESQFHEVVNGGPQTESYVGKIIWNAYITVLGYGQKVVA